jgi:hypothetical protein
VGIDNICMDVERSADLTERVDAVSSRMSPQVLRDLAIFLTMHANSYDRIYNQLVHDPHGKNNRENRDLVGRCTWGKKVLTDLVGELDIPFTNAFWIEASNILTYRIDRCNEVIASALDSSPNDCDSTPQ